MPKEQVIQGVSGLVVNNKDYTILQNLSNQMLGVSTGHSTIKKDEKSFKNFKNAHLYDI